MKKILIIILLLSFNFFSAQSMSDYFKYKGVKNIAELAHPSNNFKTGSYKIYNDRVWIKIYYLEGYYTELNLRKVGGFFTNIEIINDNDWVSPFTAIQIIKNLAYEAFKENSSEATEFERKLGKTIYEMTASELVCFIITLDWIEY